MVVLASNNKSPSRTGVRVLVAAILLLFCFFMLELGARWFQTHSTDKNSSELLSNSYSSERPHIAVLERPMAIQTGWVSKTESVFGEPVYGVLKQDAGFVQAPAILLEILSHYSLRNVIVPIYLTSDIEGSFHAVYEEAGNEMLQSSDVSVLSGVSMAKREVPIRQSIKILEENLKSPDSIAEPKNFIRQKLYATLLKHSALLQMLKLDRMWKGSQEGVIQFGTLTKNKSETLGVLQQNGAQVIFLPARTLLKVNRKDPRIAEGIRLTYESLDEMIRISKSRGVQLSILILPSKESVYRRYLPRIRLSDKARFDFYEVVYQEDKIRFQLLNYCEEKRLACVDMLPRLQEDIDRGGSPFVLWSDDFSTEGMLRIAENAVTAMRQAESLGLQRQALGQLPYALNADEQGTALKVGAAVGFIAIGLIVGVTRRRELRAMALLGLFCLYLLFQSFFRFDFFPLITFQSFSYLRSGMIEYYRAIAVDTEGGQWPVSVQEVYPLLKRGGNHQNFFMRLQSDQEAANAVATHIAKWLAAHRKFLNSTTVRFEKWKWDVLGDLWDPNRGFSVEKTQGSVRKV